MLHYGLLVLLALTIVASLKAVGIILVIAMLVAPGAIAYLLTDRFDRMLVIATAVAVGASAFGTLLSFHIDARDRRLHRAGAGGRVRGGVPVCAEAGPDRSGARHAACGRAAERLDLAAGGTDRRGAATSAKFHKFKVVGDVRLVSVPDSSRTSREVRALRHHRVADRNL